MKPQPLVLYLPDRRDVEISRFGRGNNKLGAGVLTYSRLAGAPTGRDGNHNTCPGATPECESICFAKRIDGPVKEIYRINSRTDEVPPLPAHAKLLRLHVSGDFDTPGYIMNWRDRLRERPDVRAWAYTRSWRCHSLLEFLEELRKLPNLQLFASMDPSTEELPPAGWRRAWIMRTWDAAIKGPWPLEDRLRPYLDGSNDNLLAINTPWDYAIPAYVCPEETGRKPDCERCRYCFDGKKHDVVFLEH